jgi:hypothetical protein
VKNYRATRRNAARREYRSLDRGTVQCLQDVWKGYVLSDSAKPPREPMRGYFGSDPRINPEWRPAGRERHKWTDESGIVHTLRGPRNPGKYLPHQGKREKARRHAA